MSKATNTVAPVTTTIGDVIELPQQVAKAVKVLKTIQTTELESALTAAKAGEALFNAVNALTGDADFKSIMLIAQAHNFQYKGPDIKNEMEAMLTATQALYKSQGKLK